MGLIGFPPKKQRLGKFAVHGESIHIDPDGYRALLRDVIVTWCQYDPQEGEFHYIGLHPDFDEIAPGSEVPIYEPEVSICTPCNEAGEPTGEPVTHQATWTRLDRQQARMPHKLRNVLDGDA